MLWFILSFEKFLYNLFECFFGIFLDKEMILDKKLFFFYWLLKEKIREYFIWGKLG